MSTRLVMSSLMLSLGMFLPGLAGSAQAEEVAKSDDAAVIAKQVPTYPLKTCVVSGEALGGDMGAPVDYLYQGRLVRFCCKGCIKKFNAEPEKFLKQIDEAAAKGGAEKAADEAAPKVEGAKKAGGCCGGAATAGSDAAPKASGTKPSGGCCR